MKLSLPRTNGRLVATLATLLFAPVLGRAATVIDQVPYTITASGVYELQSNLTSNVAGVDAITVLAANVVINLNGYTLSTTKFNVDFGIDVEAPNVTVRNGTVSSFQVEVKLGNSQGKAQDLNLRDTRGLVGLAVAGNDNAVVNCFIIGSGEALPNDYAIQVLSGNCLVKDNQISQCHFAIAVVSSVVSAFIQNYVANSRFGILMTGSDYYQGNVATNCPTAFGGGHAIGTENGGD